MALAALPMIAVSTALAQTPASTSTAPTETVKLEKFTVTGSFIPQASTEPIGPVAVFSESELRATGAFTPIQALRSLPSFIGNPGPTEYDSNGGNGSTAVSLRGLGAAQTLVLVNGRVTLQFANIQLLPIEAVDRIEILRDGAGVIYGSAAIGGAVNIILKKNYTGSTFNVSVGAATRSPGSRDTFQASFAAGAAKDGTSLLVAGSYFNNRTIYASQRPNSAQSDGRPRGGINGGSPTYPGVIQINGGATPMVLTPGFSTSATPTLANYVSQDQNTFSSNQLFNFRQYSPSAPGQNRNSLYVDFDQKLADNDRLTLFSSFLYSKLSSMNGLAPAPFSLDAEPGGPAVTSVFDFGPYNPGLGFNNGDFFRYRSVELGNRTSQQTFTDMRWQIGLRGVINENWKWEAARSTEIENYEQIDAGVPSLPLLDAEVAAGNFNPFGQAFSKGTATINGVAHSWDNAAALRRSETKARIVAPVRNRFYDFRLVGKLAELPAGDFGFAGGWESYINKNVFDPDDLYASGSVLGLNAFTDTHSELDSKSIFGEIKVPLLADRPFVHSLTIGALARREDQTIKGVNSATGLEDRRNFRKVNPSVNLHYAPTKDYLFRASWSKGFLAPNSAFVFGTATTTNPTLADPLGYPYKAQTTVVIRTNSELQPAESQATSFGLVGTPKDFLKGLSFSVDFYHIKVSGIVANNAASILAANAAGQGAGYVAGNPATLNPNAPFADRIHRLATGALRDTGGAAAWTQFGLAGGIRGAVLSDYLNIGSRDVEGLEYTVSYTHNTDSWGRFKYVLAANQFIKFDQTNGPGLPTNSYLGKFVSTVGDPISPGSIPKWKGNLGVTWSKNRFSGSATLNYVGSYQDDPLFVLTPKMQAFYNAGTPKSDPAFAAFLAATSSVDPKVGGIRQIKSMPTLDFQGTYDFGEDWAYTKNMTVTIGVTNAFDKLAPFAAGAFNDSYDTRTVNNIGRFVYLQLRKQF